MLLKWARCYILTRSDGQVWGYTEHNRPLIVDGVTCSPVNSIVASSAEQRVGGAIDTIDITTVFDAQHFSRVEVEAGLWDGAELRVILFDWRSREIVREFLTYSLADTSWQGNTLKGTLESAGAVKINVKTGLIGAPNCGHALGDARCGVDRASFQSSMEVTAVNGSVLSGAVPTPAAGQWQTGFAIFGTERAEIVFVDASNLWLIHPFANPPVVGDTVTLEPGCGKTVLQCKTFNNFEFFGGHGHRSPNASATIEVANSNDGREFDGGSRFES
ncbi:hypothetical protein NBRC116590_02660 [Pelagimonas sp. KU-00592-HH]|uniref:DUF2163 domain-containing protein n=1 Tax=Pelagimonas sp. KU-00592-HH TaxID=3127651 RepID=UPI00310842B2